MTINLFHKIKIVILMQTFAAIVVSNIIPCVCVLLSIDLFVRYLRGIVYNNQYNITYLCMHKKFISKYSKEISFLSDLFHVVTPMSCMLNFKYIHHFMYA